ncbi:MAG: HAMP domain-containing histidine kinase [Nocardioides sp.]|nr:HAMP domain-containing histidine kinase [Nocardioides sp.]
MAASGRGPMLDPASAPTALPSAVDGVVGGAFVAGAAFASFAGVRRRAGRGPGWIAALGLLISCQALLVTGWALADQLPHRGVNLAVLLVLGTMGLVCVGGASLRLRRGWDAVDENVAIGLGMGLMAAGYLVPHIPVDDPPPSAVLVLVGVLFATYLAAVAPVLSSRVLLAPMATLLLVTLVTVGAGLVLMVTGLRGTGWDMMVSLARTATATAWVAFAWSRLRRVADEDRRRLDDIDAALSITRDTRERLHELRSTMAGLVSGSEMLDSTDLPNEVRERLWQSVRRELCRMQRLLAKQDEPVTDIDLDEALNLILDLQRLKGRRVEVHSSGDSVHARYDALAEVINILIDNAATHGGCDESLVEVVRHDDIVDITVTDFGRGIPEGQGEEIFAWGNRDSRSPGEGIGLSMAQRLMTEDGGSLRLSDPPDVGASFVISLPAVRRSSENHQTAEDERVTSRRSR